MPPDQIPNDETPSLRKLRFDLGHALFALGRALSNGKESSDVSQELKEKESRYDAALASFKQALKEKEQPDAPSDEDIRYRIAKTYAAQHKPSLAFSTFLEVVYGLPEQTGKALGHAQDLLTHRIARSKYDWLNTTWWPKVETTLQGQDRTEALLLLARTSLYLDRFSEAEERFKAALEIDPKDTRLLEGLGESIRQAALRDPNTQNIQNAVAMLEQARIQAEQGRYPERLPGIGYKLAKILMARGNYRAALDLSLSIKDSDSEPDLLIAQSEAHLGLDDPANAKRTAQQVLTQDPTHTEALLLYARSLIASHQYQAALAAADEAQSYAPTHSQISLIKAQALIEGQIDLNEAKRLLDWYVEPDDPEDPSTLPDDFQHLDEFLHAPLLKARQTDGNLHFFLGRVFEWYHATQSDWLQKAETHADRALALDLDADVRYPHAVAHALQGEVFESLGREHESTAAFFEAGKQFYGRGDRERDDFKHAEALFRKVRIQNPHSAEVCWYLADVLLIRSYTPEPPYVDRELIRESLWIWNQGYEAQPDTQDSWVYLVRARISEQLAQLPDDTDIDGLNHRMDQLWTYVSFAERALQHADRDAGRWAYLARGFNLLNLYANAHYAITRALDLDSAQPVAGEEEVILRLNTGQYEKAREALAALMQKSEQHVYTAWEAFLYFHQGRFEAALDSLSKSARQASDTDLKWMWFRNLRAQSYRHLERPEARSEYLWIRDQMTRTDQYPHHQTEFAWAAYGLARYDEAIPIFEALRSNRLESFEANLGLSVCYLQLGRTEQAQAYLDETMAGIIVQREKDLAVLELDFVERCLGQSPSEQQGASVLVQEYKARISNISVAWPESMNPVEELERMLESDGKPGHLARPVIQTLLNRVRDTFLLLQPDAATTANTLPLLTPIRLEVAPNLVPDDTDNWALLTDHAPALRKRLSDAYGVRIPGVRVRDNAYLAPNGYLISIHEIPIERGTVQPGYVYCPGSRDAIEALGIPLHDMARAPHPLTRSEGYWVRRKHKAVVEAHGFDVWDDPFLFMIYHLEAVLRRKLSSFLGIDEVAERLASLDEMERERETIRSNPIHTLRLVRVMRALLDEQVPVGNYFVIWETLKAVGLESGEIHDVVREIRLRLKTSLPGNAPGSDRIFVPESFENDLKSWITVRDGKRYVSMPPLAAQRLLSEARSFINDRKPVLVTRDPDVRPFMRQLIALEFPLVMVLAEAEMLPIDRRSRTA